MPNEPYRDAVVLLTSEESAPKIEEMKREMAALSKQAVRDALGKSQSKPQHEGVMNYYDVLYARALLFLLRSEYRREFAISTKDYKIHKEELENLISQFEELDLDQYM